jgi:hypothetical protein
VQVKIVYALAALHNFINQHGRDPYQEASELQGGEGVEEEEEDPISALEGDEFEMNSRRDMIVEVMWASYQEYLRLIKRSGSEIDEFAPQ